MQTVGGELVVSPTDLTAFLACRHLSRLEVELARGLRRPPVEAAGSLDLVRRWGIEHEHRYLERLEAEGRRVVRVAPPGPGRAGLEAAEAATVEAMASGAEVVAQGTFFDGVWCGRADLLLRREGRPGRWPWSYDVADTKLARQASAPALMQLAAYADRLAALQGVPPEQLVIVTGDGESHAVPYAGCAEGARRLRSTFTAFVADPPPTRPERVRRCGRCRWVAECRATWRAADDLSLVAQLRRHDAERFRAAGIDTVEALAATDPGRPVAGVAPPEVDRAVHQARLQVSERCTGRPAHRLLPPAAGRGLALLPEPSPGDVFLDLEGDPFAAEGQGLEYLFGLVERDRYTAYWALEPAAEQAGFESAVDHLMAAWARDPGMHVYHYATYEPTRLTLLAARYGSRGAQVEQLISSRRLVDLYAVVKHGIQVGKESYSLKRLEDHYWGHGRGDAPVGDALSSVVAFHRWAADGADPASPVLEHLRAYNQQDCRSTQALRDWLEGLRASGGGDAQYPRPEPGAS